MSEQRHERDYLERTIATVRNHRGADNCWPQWANIFADEIEALWKIEPQPGSVVLSAAMVEQVRERREQAAWRCRHTSDSEYIGNRGELRALDWVLALLSGEQP